MLRRLGLLLLLTLWVQPCRASELDPVTEIYSKIPDLCAPSIEDLQKIQFALTHTHRPIVERMQDTAFVAKKFKFIGESPAMMPESGCIAMNSSENKRENCIITYASFNRNYPAGVRRLLQALKATDFCGHIHYRIGGWPNVAAGDLSLVHVPFAFKVCFFKEMQKMGYKRVLWLDASILPRVSPNEIFRIIEEKGFFVQKNVHPVGMFMNQESAQAFGLTVQQTENIPSCSAAIIGIDFTNEKTAPLIDAWYQAARHPCAFFSPRSDQSALSILIYQMKLADQMIPFTALKEVGHAQKDTLFYMDRAFVKPDSE